ncbi:MAG: AAA family ATPase [Deltaproteobacteria bacterium]|nr:MAG: AAA family ATPase [Deltaproteobacteria bacterium]
MQRVDSAETIKRLREEVGRAVVGQRELIDGLLIALLAGGHVLVEGVPGLAKTTAVRTLAEALGLGFRRIQFTPDLLPGDLLGTPVYVPDERRFAVRKGPIFSPVLLADEINRAPAKVQSALLEAMEESQVTIGEETFALPEPFFVMATQNPIELEGTYPLPEAQIDRFLMKLLVSYPNEADERAIVGRDAEGAPAIASVTDAAQVRALREVAFQVHLAPEVLDYVVRVVRATRAPGVAGARLAAPLERSAAGAVALGASPRAAIFLARAARARALLDGREFVTPHDVKRMAPAVLRHRVLPSYEAEADGVTPDAIVAAVLGAVDTP